MESPRYMPITPDQQGVLNHGPSYPEQRRGVQHASSADRDVDRRRRSRWRSSPAATASTVRRTTPPASRSARRCAARSAASLRRSATRRTASRSSRRRKAALNEVHSMLQRVRDLKVQYDNGTLSDATTRTRSRPRSRRSPARSGSIADRHEVQRHALSRQPRTVHVPGRRQRRRDDRDDRRSSAARSAPPAPAASSSSRPVRRGARQDRADHRRPLDADDIDNAIKNVSTARANFGAVQNRLEHRLNNLATYQENLTASESRIRDVDMAAEMTKFTKLQHPAAGRHEHARAGQPGARRASCRCCASHAAVERRRRSAVSFASLKIGPSGPIFVFEATWSRLVTAQPNPINKER